MRFARVASFALASLAWAGCLSAEPPKPREDAKQTEPPAKPDLEAAAKLALETKREPAKKPELGPPPPHAELIEPQPGLVEWTELPGLSDIRDFHPVAIGVLAQCSESWCTLTHDGRLEPNSFTAHFLKPLWGTWPSDAWQVDARFEVDEEVEGAGDERGSASQSEVVELRRWRGDDFQVEATYEAGEDEKDGWAPAIVFRKGWAGGMLVRTSGEFHRLPESGRPAPSPATVPGDLLEFFEAESGALAFVEVADPDADRYLVVHPPCASGSCDERVFRLPKTGIGSPELAWDFPLDIARGGDSLTILAVADEKDVYLLHYDAPPGTWTFEGLPGGTKPEAIWPDTRGGLWINHSALLLWYRDPQGQWFDVALPEPGGVAIGFANRLAPREFLVLMAGEPRRVFATRGPVSPAPK